MQVFFDELRLVSQVRADEDMDETWTKQQRCAHEMIGLF